MKKKKSTIHNQEFKNAVFVFPKMYGIYESEDDYVIFVNVVIQPYCNYIE